MPVGKRAMRTFVAAPASTGTYPGVVFYTDIFQLTESSLRWAVRLAGYGFVVAVPEIYHRIEPAGTVLGFDDEGKARGQADAEATPTGGLRRGRLRRARLARRALQQRRRRGPLHGRAHRLPGRVRRTRARHGVLVPDRPARRQARRGQDRLAGARRRHRRRHPADLRHQGPAHAAAGARDHPPRARRRRGRASSGASTRPSTRSGATSARATTPRRPTARSARRRPSCAASCDPLRPSRLGQLPEGAHPAAPAGAGVRAGHDRPLQRRGQAAGAPRAQPGRARPRARAGLRRTDPGVGRDPALPGRGNAIPAGRPARARPRAPVAVLRAEPGRGGAGGRPLHAAHGAGAEEAGGLRRPAAAGAQRAAFAGSRAGGRRSSPASATRSPTSRSTATCTAPPTPTRTRASTPASPPGWIASRRRRGSRTTSSRFAGRMADRSLAVGPR